MTKRPLDTIDAFFKPREKRARLSPPAIALDLRLSAPTPLDGMSLYEECISPELEAYLVSCIDARDWNTDLSRRTQQYGYFYDYRSYEPQSRLSLTESPPVWLQTLSELLMVGDIMPWVPDQFIINEYRPGQGIAAHIDHKACFRSVIVSLSLLSGAEMVFERKRPTKSKHTLYLNRRSLLVLQDDARAYYITVNCVTWNRVPVDSCNSREIGRYGK